MNTYSSVSDYRLESLKINKAFSEETLCFKAVIVAPDGTEIGEASNDGHGGSHLIHVKPEHRSAFAEEARRAVPPTSVEWGDGTWDRGEEGLIDVLLAEREARQHARRYFTFIPAGGDIESGFSFLKVGRRKVRSDEVRTIESFLASNSDVVVVEVQ